MKSMASKSALLGSTRIKVENMNGFDKSSFNQLTAPLGGLIPIKKQLILPGNVHCNLRIAAQLPPLASDAFLRAHLKVEGFFVPLRLCYGGFQSWFSGTDIAEVNADGTVSRYRAKLPRLCIKMPQLSVGQDSQKSQKTLDYLYGPQSLLDYMGVRKQLGSTGHVDLQYIVENVGHDAFQYYNIFPIISYQLIYDHFYRNKNVDLQLFCPPSASSDEVQRAGYLPYVSYKNIHDCTYIADLAHEAATSGVGNSADKTAKLFNGHLLQRRYRNYGDDYFTTCMPSAQEGNAVSISTSGGSFTIASLRAANALQEFAEVNQYASADYVQACAARYGISPSDGVAQKPVCVGTADFPLYTSGVEQTGENTASSSNPFTTVGARYGRAHAEGSDFVCDFSAKEPGYFILLASLVPEANYAQGVARDMRIFTEEGSIADLPVSKLEGTGLEPVYRDELDAVEQTSSTVFGYQPRFMWHKAGSMNEVHGHFRKGSSLASFACQRPISIGPNLGHSFLAVGVNAMDNVMATAGALSEYGCIIDSKCELFVSEPLSESKLPSLVDPAAEHGKSVYLKVGGSVFNG